MKLNEVISMILSLAGNTQIRASSNHKAVRSQHKITMGNQMKIEWLFNHDNKNEVRPFNVHIYKKENSTNLPYTEDGVVEHIRLKHNAQADIVDFCAYQIIPTSSEKTH